MMKEGEPINVGMVVEDESDWITVWSFSNLTIHAVHHCNELKKGDYICVDSLTKIINPNFKVEIVDEKLKLCNVPVRFRLFEGSTVAYSPILGRVSHVSDEYESCLNTVCAVPVYWDSDEHEWSIPVFNAQLSGMTAEQGKVFVLCEPCRGIVFRICNNSLVVWTENHRIAELSPNPKLSKNLCDEQPRVGSFLWLLVTEQTHREFPLVQEYKTIPPFFEHGLDIEGSGNLMVLENVEFEQKTENINGIKIPYVKSSFFGKIYDNINFPHTLIDTSAKGSLQVWFRGIPHDRSLLFFQITHVENPGNMPRIPTLHECLTYENTDLTPFHLRPVMHSRFTGFVCRSYPALAVFCLELKEDVLIPDAIRNAKPSGYWTGKWINFYLDEAECTDRTLVLCEPEVITPYFPTRLDKLGHPEICVTLQTKDRHWSTLYLHCPELDVDVEDLNRVCLGVGVWRLWIQREGSNSVRWRVSLCEERDSERKPIGPFINFETCSAQLPERISPSWFKSKQLRISPHPYEQAYRDQIQMQIQQPKKGDPDVSPEYCTGFVCTGLPCLFAYCLEKRCEYRLDEEILTAPRAAWIGAWLNMTIAKRPNGKEAVVHVSAHSNSKVYPIRVTNGVPEIQMICICSENGSGATQLFCPLLGGVVLDPMEIFKKTGEHTVWIMCKKTLQLVFTVAENQLDLPSKDSSETV